QSPFIVRHYKKGHEILEERAIPGSQDRLAAGSDEQPAKREPMFLRDLALCNGDIAAQTSLGGQQIIEAGIQPMFADIEPDGEQVAGGVEQKSEIHVGQLGALSSQCIQGDNALSSVFAGFLEARQQVRKML